MSARIPASEASGASAVTHGTSAEASWIDIVLADDEWVRREFDELIAYGWGGSGTLRPPTNNGAHEPRRPTPRHRPTHRGPAAAQAPTAAARRTPARSPPR